MGGCETSARSPSSVRRRSRRGFGEESTGSTRLDSAGDSLAPERTCFHPPSRRLREQTTESPFSKLMEQQRLRSAGIESLPLDCGESVLQQTGGESQQHEALFRRPVMAQS